MEIFYDRDAVHITFGANDGEIRAGGLLDFESGQARQIAAALYQAAEELDRWQEATDAE